MALDETQKPETVLHGTIVNSSRTPRNEMGGLALFSGVMMKSRTGFALAIRKSDGEIYLRQVPFHRLKEKTKKRGIPLLSPLVSLWEMMTIGTHSLNLSSELVHGNADKEKTSKTEKKKRRRKVLSLSLILMLFFIIFVPDFLTTSVFNVFLAESYNESDFPFTFSLVSGIVRLSLFVLYVFFIGLDREIREVFQNHGAEHKAVHALERGGDVTVAKAMNMPRFHPRCGTTFLALAMILLIPVYAVINSCLSLYLSGYPGWPLLFRKIIQISMHLAILPFVLILTFETIKAASRNSHKAWSKIILWPGYILQKLTTREPNAHQVEVAIVSLLAALAIPSYQRKSKSWSIGGLEDDPTAPGFVAKSPARIAGSDVDS